MSNEYLFAKNSNLVFIRMILDVFVIFTCINCTFQESTFLGGDLDTVRKKLNVRLRSFLNVQTRI
jgi:hypothetical protein